ncbi:cytochrome b/b6 domain-containing protein [Shewanella intestini]|uniref:Cytochrome b/b6 domain-containing protein n=1 Tax=Shewanella intestini TaxID=2017544 RepID=A0ABS5I643_9GAMM|nr:MULTISPECIES: cytochrome b/b6 domain-containing protein [Shewanella]MBR9729461.1 cytochrome b/b6 domain-containing protein [Shewanella intestini]MRG35078.1 cytochrome b/b6 domain-containing protein [Shewanella sp. XMDDZSB0408]
MKLPRFMRVLSDKLHVLIIACCFVLLPSSSWILIGRQLRKNANIWEYIHVYLGAIAAILGVLFVVKCCLKGGWRQFFPWLNLQFSQLIDDIVGLCKLKLPSSGGKGLLSVVEGIGLILLMGVCVTGLMWLIFQGQADALSWRKYHIIFAQGLCGFVLLHMVFAVIHVVEMIKNA